MDEIYKVIDIFLQPYISDENIQAAILTGSYSQGNQNKYSDIDVFIISSDNLNWRERGNKIVSNYLFEYFINPPKIILQQLEEKSIVTASIIANGKEIFDKTGIVKKIKEKAFEVAVSPIERMNNNEIEMMKYYLNYYHEQLTRAYEYNTNEFMFLYYTYLEYILYSYGKYAGIALPARTKIYQYIFDEDYYLNKELKKICDNNFLEILRKCMKDETNEIMYKNIMVLKNYLLDFAGGFNIDGWKIRTEI